MFERRRIARLIGRPLPPFGGWAISADLALYLVRLVERLRPKLVVELGAGSSSIVLGRTLQRFSEGRLVSVEQEREFLPDVSGLPVEVRIAEVTDWYDRAVLQDLTGIDLLVIDGPRGGKRYDALPYFWERLNHGAYVVLDDANRKAERQILERWRREFPIHVETIGFEKGAAVFTR